MHAIVYVSEYTKSDESINQDLNDITKIAKETNPTLDITGLLFYHNRKFLQIIEGEKESLEKLMVSIEKDPRHRNIERLIDEKAIRRSYKDWNMDSFNLSDHESLDLDKLKIINKIYKESWLLESEILIDFYKLMLQQEDLTKYNI